MLSTAFPWAGTGSRKYSRSASRIFPRTSGLTLTPRPATIAGPGDEISALAFDPQAARLAAARADGSVAIYPVSGPELRNAAEQLVGTLNPTADECLRLFGASNQCEEIGEWRLMTQRIFRAITGR